jgi:hypothetical protein
LAVPFVLLDISGFLYSFPFEGSWLYSALFFGLIANRTHVLFAASMNSFGGRRVALSSLLAYPSTLLFVPLAALSALPLTLVAMMLAIPLIAANVFGQLVVFWPGLAARLGLFLLTDAILAVALAVTLLLILIGVAATMDVIAEGSPAPQTFLRWLRWSFRRRTLVSTLLAATIYIIMFVGVSDFMSGLAFGPYRLNAFAGIPNGIADTLSFAFVWQWRKAVLDRELGRDLIAELETAAAPPVPAGSVP